MSRPVKPDGAFNKTGFSLILRKAIGSELTQRQFAKKAGVSVQTLTHYLSQNNDTPPNPKTICLIANASDGRVSVQELLSYAGYHPDHYSIHMEKDSDGNERLICITRLFPSETSNYLFKLIKNSFILRSIISSDYFFDVIEHPIIPTDISIAFKNLPFTFWHFRIYHKDINTHESIIDFMHNWIGNLMLVHPHAELCRFSIIVCDNDSFDILSNLKNINCNHCFSIILYDLDSERIIKESMLDTSSQEQYYCYKPYNILNISKDIYRL